MRLLLLTISIIVFLGCSSVKPIKVAYIATLKGKNSELGISGRTGVRMAIKGWNERGGITVNLSSSQFLTMVAQSNKVTKLLIPLKQKILNM